MIYRYLPYTLTLQSPAIISALGGDPNSSSTLPFIPGAAVRGAMAKSLGDPGNDPAKQQEFRDLIFGGRVRYFHAYPSRGEFRSVPVPLSLRREKDDPGNHQCDLFDLAAFEGHPAADEDPGSIWPEEQLAPLPQRFLTIGSAQPVILQTDMSARLHHQRDRQKGRAWKDQQGHTHGAIFAYESIDAGQTFQGVIQVRCATDEEVNQTERRVKELLGSLILVGRSRRAGYGGMAALQWGNVRHREVQGVGREGLRPVASDIPKGDLFRLLLTAAAIVRHPETGHLDPAALPALIETRLQGQAKVLRIRWAFEPVGGFNRTWRLELPQILAVSAGSVFVLEALQPIPHGDLLALEHEGLGERKEEGFGRFVFLDKPMQKITLGKPREGEPLSIGHVPPPPLVLDIEAKIIWTQVLRAIEEKAVEVAASAKNLPSNSLIGRLRTPLRGDPEKAIETLKLWLRDGSEAERLKKTAMKQLERCEVDGHGNLHQWILRATDAEQVLSWLRTDVLVQRNHIVSVVQGHYHRFGGGKPLGFGSVRLTIENCDLRTADDLRAKYRSWHVPAAANEKPCQEAVACFQEAVCRAYGGAGGKGSFEQVPFIAAFQRACKGFDDALPIHYPRVTKNPNPDGESFQWFVANERQGARLALRDLVRDPGLPILQDGPSRAGNHQAGKTQQRRRN